MTKVQRLLLPVNGSASSDRAIRYLIERWGRDPRTEDLEVHLLNVQHPLSGDVTAFVDHDAIKQHHHDEGLKALETARRALDKEGIPYFFHVAVGDPAEIIAHFAREKKCDEIVVGTRGASRIADVITGSVASRVSHLADVPVVLVK